MVNNTKKKNGVFKKNRYIKKTTAAIIPLFVQFWNKSQDQYSKINVLYIKRIIKNIIGELYIVVKLISK